MPDLAMVHGRMLVCAWETGLADVQDTAVKLLMLALEVVLSSYSQRERAGVKIHNTDISWFPFYLNDLSFNEKLSFNSLLLVLSLWEADVICYRREPKENLVLV